MTSLEWLQAAGCRYLQVMEADDIVFLNQIQIEPDEMTELLRHVGNGRPMPWADWVHACVAVAAVQVAREAEGDENSLPKLFLGRIGLTYDQKIWEEEYGKRIEYIINRFFPDDYVGYGGFRYVGPVYRHVGIPLVATRKFGHLVRNLLQRYGPSFTRDEYDLAREPIGGVASRFLASEHGYVYARTAVRILNRIDLNQIVDAEVDTIPRFRHGFWTEILAAAGGPQFGSGVSRNSLGHYVEPCLALSLEDSTLELRFDWRGVQRGIYRLNGRTVTNAFVRYCSEEHPRIETSGRRFPLDRWWYPGMTKAALFRTSDGGFVTSSGGVPPGTYYLISQDGCAASDCIDEEVGYLFDTDWGIWRVTLRAREELEVLGLHVTGGAPSPQLEFSARQHHAFGTSVFESALPSIVIRNWDQANASRYSIVVDAGSRSYSVKVPVGERVVSESVPCPSTGFIRVEPQGLARQESALSVLPFTVLPRGIKIYFSKDLYAGDEPANIRCAVPEGWHVIWQGEEQRESWEVPASATTVDGMVSDGSFHVGFSLRVPRVSVAVTGDGTICWKESDVQRVYVHGPSQLNFELVLVGDGNPYLLTSIQTVATNGTIRIEASHFRDSLRTCPLSAGEFAIRLTSGTLVRSGYYYASVDRIQAEIASAPVSSTMFQLPNVGIGLASIWDLLRGPPTSFDWNPPRTPENLKTWFATLACCAHSFDGATVNGNPDRYAHPELAEVCEWYVKAAIHTGTGDSSRELLDHVPANWLRLPLERWRRAIRETLARLESQADGPKLLREWRLAVQCRDGSAALTDLGKRAGGAELSEGARQYLVAVRMDSLKARNQSLNKAIRELERSRAITNCLVIRGAAAVLLSLAYRHSGRLNMLSADLKIDREQAGLDESDVSPWEKDYGNTDFAGARAMAADRTSVSN